MSKKTQPAPAQEQPNGEAPEAIASASNASPVEPAEPAAATEATTPDGIQEPSAPTESEVQAQPPILDLTATQEPEKVTVRLLFALGTIPAGKAVTLTAEHAAALVAQGDADDHPEAVQYAVAQSPAIEYVAE